MARTINGALTQLVEEKVNLLKSRTDAGRRSRDHLLEQIKRLNNDSLEKLDFAEMYNLPFGSFSRRTKVKPLDDIDQMIGLNGGKLVWNEATKYNEAIISIRDPLDKGIWSQLLNDDNSTLSPTKVLNRFKRMLSNMSGYQNPELNKRQQAVTFQMTSNEWNFDLVPCFYTQSGVYLIPSGNGNYWMQTDPRNDQVLATQVNQQHNGKVLEIIRLMKYWNKQDRKPSILSSYLLEVMLLYFYKSRRLATAGTLQEEVEKCLIYIRDNIYSRIEDPKKIEGNINRLDNDVRHKIYARVIKDLEDIKNGNDYEINGEKERAFECWENVLGSFFPAYG